MPEIALRQVSAQPNGIVDDEDWSQRTGVQLPVYDLPGRPLGPPSDVPPSIPLQLRGLNLTKAIRGEEVTLLFYGSYWVDASLLVGWDLASSRALYAYDFAHYRTDLRWAVQKGRTLYVSHTNQHYAKVNRGKNAYLSAIDLDRRRLLWRSPALVANSANFLVEDGLILTGYGFTREPDFIYLFDSGTGAVRGRHKVQSMPEIFGIQGGKLHVRCYDTDYVFELPTAVPPPAH